MASSKLCVSKVCSKVWHNLAGMRTCVVCIMVLCTVLPDMPRVAQLLQSLTSVDRFSTIVLFLSKQEKEGQAIVLLCIVCAFNAFCTYSMHLTDLRELFREMRECFSDCPAQLTLNIQTLEEQFGLM